ncbi:MAG: hypothetical protein JSU70_04410 [Phycisphaerales bacterium]|nr:MAG: hypothetical protein JSU70_04410 [Phycisphaerales bacterium]
MRAYELVKETFWRRRSIWIVHVLWLSLYLMFWWLYYPDPEEFGGLLFLCGGFLLPLALGAGILGDDIASGRICVVLTRPLRPGTLFSYRLLGLSLQAAVHFMLAGIVILAFHVVTGKGSTEGLALWLFLSWLLFNTWAALSTSSSVLVKRSQNSLLLLVASVTVGIVINFLIWHLRDYAVGDVLKGFLRYCFPPYGLLTDLGKGEFEEKNVALAGLHLPRTLVYAVHSLLLTVVYAVPGILIFRKKQFLSERD